jgi:hypothetical protein
MTKKRSSNSSKNTNIITVNLPPTQSDPPSDDVQKPKNGCFVNVAIIVALIGLIGVIFPVLYQDLAPRFFFPATLTPTLTLTPIPSPLPSLTVTLTPSVVTGCPYQGKNDDETITHLIDAEAVASNLDMDARMTILNKIFDSNALIRDFAVPDAKFPKTWRGPAALQQYRLSNSTRVRNVEHFDIFPTENGIIGNLATYTSGSQGEYINDITPQWTQFTNGSISQYGSIKATTYGSEHWILQKDSLGCWRIIQFDYDAGHINFP